jgi:hypothetical protein
LQVIVICCFVFVAFVECLHLTYFRPLKRLIIHVMPGSKWDEYQRLTTMLTIGMDSSEVEKILGKPNAPIVRQADIECWIYDEEGPTAGWTYIAEFQCDGSTSNDVKRCKLCYLINTEHVLFPNSERSEMGKRIALKQPEESLVFGLLKPSIQENK